MNVLGLKDIDRASGIVQHLRDFGRQEGDEMNEAVSCHKILIISKLIIYNKKYIF